MSNMGETTDKSSSEHRARNRSTARLTFDVLLFVLVAFYVVAYAMYWSSLGRTLAIAFLVFAGISFIPKLAFPDGYRHFTFAEAYQDGFLKDWAKLSTLRLAAITIAAPALWTASDNFCTTGSTYMGLTCWELRALASFSHAISLLALLLVAGIVANIVFVVRERGGNIWNEIQPN